LVGTNGITAFEPEAGRVWREWVLIMRPNPDDYRNDMGLFQESIRFVA
jgi:hypothetical protein